MIPAEKTKERRAISCFLAIFLLPPQMLAHDQKNPNLYAYGRNNPLIITDPTGKWSLNNNDDWVCDNKNDTLWSLSEKVYGDGSQWDLLNFGSDPGKLQIGDILNSKRFGIANTAISAQTPADKFREALIN